MELSDRKKKILQAIIDEYVGTAEPVGSRAISKRDDLGLSSATIRNEMADLEDMGYLVKPHTSAGRIPSDIGYRFYVNSLMERYQLGVEAVEGLAREFESRVNQLDMLIKKASDITSALTEYTTVITSPALGRSVIRKIDFIKMSGSQAMLLIVTKAGLVKHTMISVEVSDSDALKISDALNIRLSGMVAEMITQNDFLEIAKISNSVEKETLKTILDNVYKAITELDRRDVYVNNARKILEYPEFSDMDKAREMLDFLEDKDNLIKIISEDDKDGVGIKIGKENNIKELENTSLITVDYKVGDRTLGKIGVIGPKRMNYAKVVASLDLISGHIDKILGEIYNPGGEIE